MVLSPGQLEVLCNTLLNELKEKNIPHNLGKDGGNKRAKEIFVGIHEDFCVQPILQKKFEGDFYNFFDYLLDWSYGLGLDRTSTEKGRPKFKKIVRTEEDERRMLEKVDMFCLVDYLHQTYKDKRFREYIKLIDIEYKETTIKLKKGNYLSLEVIFNEDFWENIYNDYPTYAETNGKEEVCLFNRAKYSIASYLHSADPYVHYLTIKSDDENNPNPLCTAILIEREGEQKRGIRKEYMIVEGVVGNLSAFDEQDREKIYDFLWQKIQEFSFNLKRNVFINTCHSQNQNEPHEFVSHISRKIRKVKGDILKDEEGHLNFRLTRPKKVLKETDTQWYTHYFTNKKDQNFITSVSNRSKEDRKYNGEQYADTFYLGNKREFPQKDHFNSFFELGGYAQGFEVSYQNRPLRKFFGIALPVAVIELFTILSDIYGTEIYTAKMINNIQKKEVIAELGDLLIKENNGSIKDDILVLEEKHKSCFIARIDNQMHCYDPEIVMIDIADITDLKTTSNFSGYPLLNIKVYNGTKNIPLQRKPGAKRIADLIETYRHLLSHEKKLIKCEYFSLKNVTFDCISLQREISIPLYEVIYSGNNMQRLSVETEKEVYILKNGNSLVIDRGMAIKLYVEEQVEKNKKREDRSRSTFGTVQSYEKYVDNVAESIPNQKLIFHMLELLAMYDTPRVFDMKNEPTLLTQGIAIRLNEEVVATGMQEQVEAIVQFFMRENVLKTLKYAESTHQHPGYLLYLFNAARISDEIFERVRELTDYYLQKQELVMPGEGDAPSEYFIPLSRNYPGSHITANQFREKSFKDFKKDDSSNGVKVLFSVYNALISIDDIQFSTKYVELIDHIKERKDYGDIVMYATNFMVSPRDKENSSNCSFYNSIPLALVDIMDSYVNSKWLPEIMDYFVKVNRYSNNYCLSEKSGVYEQVIKESCIIEEIEKKNTPEELAVYLDKLYHLPKIEQGVVDYSEKYHLCERK